MFSVFQFHFFFIVVSFGSFIISTNLFQLAGSFILHNQQKIWFSFSFSLSLCEFRLERFEMCEMLICRHQPPSKPIWYAYAMACIYYSDSNYPMCLISQCSRLVLYVYRCSTFIRNVAFIIEFLFHCIRCRQNSKKMLTVHGAFVYFFYSTFCILFSSLSFIYYIGFSSAWRHFFRLASV